MRIWNQPHLDLERLNAFGTDNMVGTVGIVITQIGDDFLRGTLPVDTRTRQPFGLLHGGASVVLAETLGSLAAFLTLPDPRRQQAVGLEINANHIRAVRSGLVTGTARAEHLGRATQVWSIRIVDENDRLVCISRLTMAIVERAAEGA